MQTLGSEHGQHDGRAHEAPQRGRDGMLTPVLQQPHDQSDASPEHARRCEEHHPISERPRRRRWNSQTFGVAVYRSFRHRRRSDTCTGTAEPGADAGPGRQ
jgi:hypothetical protein